MSLDKLIAAATDYFITGADVHRRALAGGGGKITDFSAPATKKIASNTTKTTAKEQTGADDAMEAEAAVRAAAAEAKAAEAKAAHQADLDAQEAAEYEQHARDKETKAAAKAAAESRDDYLGPQADDLAGISYEEDIRPVLRAKSLANRDALVALLGKFNVKSGQELTADQYPAFLAGLKAI